MTISDEELDQIIGCANIAAYFSYTRDLAIALKAARAKSISVWCCHTNFKSVYRLIEHIEQYHDN